VEVSLSTLEVTQRFGVLDCDDLAKLRDELAEALADAEYHLARIRPETGKEDPQ
jgi:DNA-directed RNA polymerase subunit F